MEALITIAVVGVVGGLMWLAVKRGNSGKPDRDYGSDGTYVFDSGSSDSSCDSGDSGGGGDCGGSSD
jgi:hypothetical protein